MGGRVSCFFRVFALSGSQMTFFPYLTRFVQNNYKDVISWVLCFLMSNAAEWDDAFDLSFCCSFRESLTCMGLSFFLSWQVVAKDPKPTKAWLVWFYYWHNRDLENDLITVKIRLQPKVRHYKIVISNIFVIPFFITTPSCLSYAGDKTVFWVALTSLMQSCSSSDAKAAQTLCDGHS